MEILSGNSSCCVKEKLLLQFAESKNLKVEMHIVDSFIAHYEINVPYKNINLCISLDGVEYEMFQEQGLLPVDERINRTC